MRSFLLFFLCVYSLVTSAGTCNDADIHSVKAKVNPGTPDSKTLTIKYRFVDRSLDPSLPIVIFIPGGPGSPSINGSLNRVPAQFSLVLTDIRGVGCNAFNPATLPDNAINTDNAVEDLVMVIKDLGERPYIVYGNSYGTVLATRLVHALENRKIRTPEKVVLSGVMARTFKTAEEVESPYIEIFEKLKKNFSPAVTKLLSTEEPLAIKGTAWADLIQNLLVQGSLLNEDTAVNLLSNQLTLLETELGQLQLQGMLTQIGNQSVSDDIIRVRSAIGCKEMFPPSTLRMHTFTLKNGSLIQTDEPTICSNGKVEQPYDVSSFKIKTPVVYVQGLSDPATPPAQALYHFESQSEADRLLILLEKGGHNPLNLGMTEECKLKFWMGVSKDFEQTTNAISACKIPHQVIRASAKSN